MSRRVRSNAKRQHQIWAFVVAVEVEVEVGHSTQLCVALAMRIRTDCDVVGFALRGSLEIVWNPCFWYSLNPRSYLI